MRVLVRVIPTVCAILVAAASFALSYVALRDVAARTAAVPADMAWLTPICVDGAVLAGSASLWASSMRGTRKDPVAALTVVTLLIVSVVINVNHAGPAALAKVIAALPPLTLLACLELVAGQYRRDAEDLEAEQAADSALAAVKPAAAVEPPLPAPSAARPAAAAAPAAPAPVRPTLPAAAAAEETAPRPATSWHATEPTPSRTAVTSPAASPAPTAERVSTARQGAEATAAPTAPTVLRPVPAKTPVPPARREAAASGPSTPTVRADVAPARGGDEASGATRIRELFQAHLDDGGSATDPTLARAFATELSLQPAYVRKVLGPLRREMQPA